MKYLEFEDKEIMAFHTSIANNIRKIRKEKNITQLDLALAIGHKSMSTIGKIEAGLENKHYNVEQLYKIAKVLEVDICDFFISHQKG
ncbi:helix-turn-helix transcriptional regulator [Sulfurovum sp. bin170]|uniref:helix-turn-helix transcriptional regulator n=1 Tax=Sulfurovum sp. bin170 TaxID=2695268 RepID=UPI00210828DD|nr:helix-turn-helix transcriptional regulator [Sulfurovum sp. bin170]